MIMWLCVVFGLMAAAGACCCYVPCYYFGQNSYYILESPDDWEIVSGSWERIDFGDHYRIKTDSNHATILCRHLPPGGKNAISGGIGLLNSIPRLGINNEVRIYVLWTDSSNHSYVRIKWVTRDNLTEASEINGSDYSAAVGITHTLCAELHYVAVVAGVDTPIKWYTISYVSGIINPGLGSPTYPRFNVCYSREEITVSFVALGSTGFVPALYRFNNISPPSQPLRWGFGTGSINNTAAISPQIAPNESIAKGIVPPSYIYNVSGHEPGISDDGDCEECKLCDDAFGRNEELPDIIELTVNSTTFPHATTPGVGPSPYTCVPRCSMDAMAGVYVLSKVGFEALPEMLGCAVRTPPYRYPACAWLLQDAVIVECDLNNHLPYPCPNNAISIDMLVVIETRTYARVTMFLRQHGTVSPPSSVCKMEAYFTASLSGGRIITFTYSPPHTGIGTSTTENCGQVPLGTVVSMPYCQGVGLTNQLDVDFNL